MQLCLTNLCVILEIDPYVISLDFFQRKNYRSDFKCSRESAKNDSLFQIKEKVRIYANSKCLDRNVRWVLFIFAEYIIYFISLWLISGIFVDKWEGSRKK